MADAENPRRLGHVAARTLWLFQALIAGCLAIVWWNDILWEVERPSYGANAYPVIRELFLTLLAAMIVYAVIVQWHHPDPHPRVTARLELGKGLIATAVWGWLLLDAVFFVPGYPYYNDPYCRRRTVRITFTAWSIAIPCT
ncbi:hypothetical protein F5883DRAFT_232405 [Diaporthe sp. PMI_573]|nr:hypothetical protein F5883DRAFT_232405 [Diaporthaceae sp. PMI_573]